MIVITGPTASGKSALAIDVARRLGTEIISADSRQIYRDIPISTAAPDAAQLAAAKHHLIGILGLDEYYSASMFEEDALRIGRRVMDERGVVVVCGGAMMYLDALCHGIDELPTVPDDIRRGLQSDFDTNGAEWLLEELRKTDETYFHRVDKCNLKRVFHAVEVSRAAGVPYSSLLTGERKKRDFRIVKICLEAPREVLFDRINRRVDQMVADGLEEEARRVWPQRELNSLNTVGLKEMFAWFEGRMQREEALERIKKNTRVYAKKQLTWFKRDEELIRIDLRSERLTDVVVDRAFSSF